jgi:hypothetical protein
MVIGCAAAGPWATAVPAYRVSLLMAALCITAASCPWIAGRNRVPRMRGAAVLIAATAIAGVMWQWPPDTGSGPERAAPAEAAPLWSHLVKQRPESACLAMQSSRGVFDHDWGGARYDALLLYGDAPGAEAARRSLWRATSSVRPCGYLALSLPAEHLAPAAFRQSRGRALHLVTLHRAGERWTALVLGPDPGAWLERWVPDEYVYEVRPVDSLAAMRGAITE